MPLFLMLKTCCRTCNCYVTGTSRTQISNLCHGCHNSLSYFSWRFQSLSSGLSKVLCHNLRLHMPKICGIGKTVLSVSCARFKSHFWKSRPFPTLRQRNICICPCLSRSTQISRLCPFSSRRQAE